MCSVFYICCTLYSKIPDEENWYETKKKTFNFQFTDNRLAFYSQSISSLWSFCWKLSEATCVRIRWAEELDRSLAILRTLEIIFVFIWLRLWLIKDRCICRCRPNTLVNIIFLIRILLAGTRNTEPIHNQYEQLIHIFFFWIKTNMWLISIKMYSKPDKRIINHSAGGTLHNKCISI